MQLTARRLERLGETVSQTSVTVREQSKSMTLRVNEACDQSVRLLDEISRSLLALKNEELRQAVKNLGAASEQLRGMSNHIQQIVTPDEEHLYDLGVLRSMTAQIAGLCGLNIFSSEIALTANNHWVVVDYVNDPCDYRAKSMVTNGVPDTVVEVIAERIAVWSKKWARHAAGGD